MMREPLETLLGAQLIMWTTLGLVFGVAAERQFAQHSLTS
jgi:hypothetical protein